MVDYGHVGGKNSQRFVALKTYEGVVAAANGEMRALDDNTACLSLAMTPERFWNVDQDQRGNSSEEDDSGGSSRFPSRWMSLGRCSEGMQTSENCCSAGPGQAAMESGCALEEPLSVMPGGALTTGQAQTAPIDPIDAANQTRLKMCCLSTWVREEAQVAEGCTFEAVGYKESHHLSRQRLRSPPQPRAL
jgi:hypothetical protein